jgi:plastocyanin
MKKIILAIAGLLLCWSASGSEVNGRVIVNGRKKKTAAPAAAVVYLEPLTGSPPLRESRYELVQKGKAFVPHILAIPAGSTVTFPNHDPIFHNVFSLSSPAPFDLGLYKAGASESRVFSHPATYRVFCNIHSQMSALIVVLPTPYITQTDGSGAYHIEVPPGKYRVTAWSERSESVSTDVTVPSNLLVVPDLTLDESHYVDVPHLNKYGQPYSSSTYDNY